MNNIKQLGMSEAACAHVAWVYNQTADCIEEPPLALWDRYGRRTVDRLALAPGAKILDAGCGAGSAALRAAELAGSAGKVLGVDLAQDLLAVAQRRAVARGLNQVRFDCRDMTDLRFQGESFDAVISVFSIFFVEDMEALVAEFWRMLKPGGTLAITTWGPPIFDPLDRMMHEAAAPYLPNLVSGPTAMDRVLHPHLLEQVMRAGGAENATAIAEQGSQELPDAGDWWTMALGSGLRRIIASLQPSDRVSVRRRLLHLVQQSGATSVATNVVYGVASKPMSSSQAGEWR